MGLYLGGLIIRRIFASEILGGLLLEFYGIYNKQHHTKVLLDSFHLNNHTEGFHSDLKF